MHLTQYCAQNNQLDKLLALVQKKNPAKYAELSATLPLEETSGAPTTSPSSQPATPAAARRSRTSRPGQTGDGSASATGCSYICDYLYPFG